MTPHGATRKQRRAERVAQGCSPKNPPPRNTRLPDWKLALVKIKPQLKH